MTQGILYFIFEDMHKDIDITLNPKQAALYDELKHVAALKSNIKEKDIVSVRYLRKSIDARRRDIKINARVRVFIGEEDEKPYDETFFSSACKRDVIIVGSGPAGLFAALTLLEKGYRPIVLERGKNVHERKQDTANLNRTGVLNESSNYCFGEGGAGAFSDGKLYTRSDKRGNISKVLSLFVQHGANPEILYESHPHIGTEKLPRVIENIRNTIIKYGGEVHFEALVTGLIKSNSEVIGVKSSKGDFFGPVIMATGHSSHDVYQFLYNDGYSLQAKDVAIGVRLEHPQALIDQIQYHDPRGRGKYLPAAAYSFVSQVNNRGVYSFCMCPGGFVVPAATQNGYQVVNGMSPSSRNSRWANSGMVVQLKCEDIDNKNPLSMLEYIRGVEKGCFFEGFKAPAQRMKDFVENKISDTLPDSSYIPGLVSCNLNDYLPSIVSSSLREGFLKFSSYTKGMFLTNDALMLAPETRTSSPVRILRNEEAFQIRGLYPCGEGAGYAGGIVSAALDGIFCANQVMKHYE